MRAPRVLAAVVAALAMFGFRMPCIAENRLVDIIPVARSGETNQDSEPTIAVDPQNPLHMVVSAFTWDNLAGPPKSMLTATAPLYISLDGGETWTLSYVIPSAVGAGYPTRDITLAFGSPLSAKPSDGRTWLYAAALSSTTAATPLVIMRSSNVFSAAQLTPVDTRTGRIDQPHTAVLNAGGSGAPSDRLFIGINNGYGGDPCPPVVAPNGRSATLEVTQDAAVQTPTFALRAIDSRNADCQDGYAEVPAVHPDGTVYAAFFHNLDPAKLVVVRDDAFGTGTQPFGALTDVSDHLSGQVVADGLTLPWGFMGQNRLGASNISIAVDPRDSSRVYVAWGDGGADTETLHVRRSTDRGQHWSADLITIQNALNPEIAIARSGTIGMLYQRVVSARWETRLVFTSDADASIFDIPGVLLANTDATRPLIAFDPYLGDYASLVAIGSSFFGVFCANNFPDPNSFPQPSSTGFPKGVLYQRYAIWGAPNQAVGQAPPPGLYADADHKVPVPSSIDPFFFEVDAPR